MVVTFINLINYRNALMKEISGITKRKRCISENIIEEFNIICQFFFSFLPPYHLSFLPLFDLSQDHWFHNAAPQLFVNSIISSMNIHIVYNSKLSFSYIACQPQTEIPVCPVISSISGGRRDGIRVLPVNLAKTQTWTDDYSFQANNQYITAYHSIISESKICIYLVFITCKFKCLKHFLF